MGNALLEIEFETLYSFNKLIFHQNDFTINIFIVI